MQYDCIIKRIIDDEEVTVKIGNVEITGFVNCGCDKSIGDNCKVDMLLYDDLVICELFDEQVFAIRKGEAYSYEIRGILDVENSLLKSAIDFEVDKEELINYGYLNGKFVSMNVVRIDLDFK